jgi:hypothetical protein
MTTTNQFGLSRHVPADVKRQVRQRCFFGCVICGGAIVEYEHFDPLFKEARTHNSQGITLLCPDHHTEAGKGLLTKTQVVAADRNPKCAQVGYADYVFNLGGVAPNLVVGGNQIGSYLAIGDQRHVEILAPEPGSQRWQISAEFPDKDGNTVCKIVENELQISNAAYDFEQVANRFTIKEAGGRTILGLRAEPPQTLYVDELFLQTPLGTFEVRGKSLGVTPRQGSTVYTSAGSFDRIRIWPNGRISFG